MGIMAGLTVIDVQNVAEHWKITTQQNVKSIKRIERQMHIFSGG